MQNYGKQPKVPTISSIYIEFCNSRDNLLYIK